MIQLEHRLAADPDEVRGRNALATLLSLRGHGNEAIGLTTRLQGEGPSIQYHSVAAFAAAGEIDVALDGLEQVVDDGYRQAGWLRHDPAFSALLPERRCRKPIGRLEGL